MTARLIEALMLAKEWRTNRLYCNEVRKGKGCAGCVYDKKQICDTATTEFVLESIGEAAEEYFSNLPKD